MELCAIEEADVTLHEKLGEGSFGVVRLGIVQRTSEKVAIKLEPQSRPKSLLEREAHVLKKLQRKAGIPLLHSYGTASGWNYMVMQLLGNSLNYKWQLCGKRFSLSTLLGCAEQMTIALSGVHSESYVHRDIKPQNFLIGRGDLSTTVFLIDFGLAKKFNERSAVSPYRSHRITGTLPFASLNVHSGLNVSMRDDLESLAYVLLYFLNGSLPWYSATFAPTDEREVRRLKESADPMSLCANQPEEFGLLLKYARQLRFEDFPDYAFILSLFRGVAQRMGLSLVVVPDWENGKSRKKTHNPEVHLLGFVVKKKDRKMRGSLRLDEEEPQQEESDIRRVHSLTREPILTRSQTQEKLFEGFQNKRAEILQKVATPSRLSRETTSDTSALNSQPSLKPSQSFQSCGIF